MKARRSGNHWQGISGASVMGFVAIALLIYECDFAWRRVSGEAVALENSYSGGRSGRTLTEVRHWVDGRPTRATLRAWHLSIGAGERIAILYRPGVASDVVPASYGQLHFGSTIAAALFLILATWEICIFVSWRMRPKSMLLDDNPDASQVIRSLEKN